MVETQLETLGFERTEIRLYLNLLRSPATSVAALAKRTGVRRTTLYGALERLTEKGLLRETTRNGIKAYAAEPPDKILMLFSQRRENLESAELNFRGLLPSLRAQQRATSTTPRFTLYEGEEGLRNVLKDMLLYADLETCSFWPIRRMLEALSPDFFRFHNRERIRRNLYTRAIWPKSEAIKVRDFPFLGWGPEFKREIRIAPESIQSPLGYWFYANKVAFLSSVEEGYGFIVESAEMVEMLKTQFELVWAQSKPMHFNETDTQAFLQEFRNR